MWKYISRSVRAPFDKGVWSNLTSTAASDQNRTNACSKEGKLQVICPFRLLPNFLDACQRHFSQSGVQGVNHEEHHGRHKKESSSKRKSESFHSNLHFQPCPIIGWSGILVLGWTILQPWCHRRENRRKPPPVVDSNVNKDTVTRYNCLYTLLFHAVLTQPIGNNVLPSRIPLPKSSLELTAPLSSPVSSSSSSPLSTTSESKTVEEIFDDAAEEVRRVHEQAIAEAENRLGVACLSHMKNNEAVQHFRVASAFKHASAAFNLGQCYELGIGTERNLVQAVENYKIASDQGHPVAAYNLGVFYAHGQGGLKIDRRKARNLFIVAASLGQPDAKAALKLENESENDVTVPWRQMDNTFESHLAMDFFNLHNIGLHFTKDEPNMNEHDKQYNEMSSGYVTSEQGSPTSTSISSPTSSLTSYWSIGDSLLNDNHHITMNDDSSEVISDTCSDEWEAAVDLVTLNGNSATLYKLAVCYENSKKVDPDILLKLYRMAAEHGHQAAKRHLLILEEQYSLGTLDDFIKFNKNGMRQPKLDCTYQK